VAFVTLSESSGYRLEHQQQDWRGWPVQDAHGHTLGRVTDFIIDTEGARAVSLVLDTAAHVPLDEVRVRDKYLVALHGATRPSRGATAPSRGTDRAAEAAALRPFENGSLDVQERAEIAVITTHPKVIEELVISHEIVERKERVETTVRRVDVDVERLPEPRGNH
jgi:hypothetical protein